MATEVIIVPRNATQWGGKSFDQCAQERDFGAICKNCGKGWGAHYDKECPEHTKTVQIRTKQVKSTCVKFQPKVEKELLRLGIKHALLAEMKLQGLLATRLEEVLLSLSAANVIHVAMRWSNTRVPINGNHPYLHWSLIFKKARN